MSKTKPRFSILSVLILTLVVALITGWLLDNRHKGQEIERLKQRIDSLELVVTSASILRAAYLETERQRLLSRYRADDPKVLKTERELATLKQQLKN